MRDWQRSKEVGGRLVIRLTGVLLRLLPHSLLVLLAYPVSFFYYLTSPKARASLSSYIARQADVSGKRLRVYPFFLSFAVTLLEKGEGWAGKVRADKVSYAGDGVSGFLSVLREGRGAVMIMSHLGSAEEIRALKTQLEREQVGREIPIVTVVDFDVADKFFSMLGSLNPDVSMGLMSIRDMDVSSIERMEEVIAKGGVLAIAGDRSGERNIKLSFLGREADFPYGTFYIPALLGAPVYFLHCVRERTFGLSSRHIIDIKKPESVLEGSARRARRDYAEALAHEYSANLEKMCGLYPYQWYNFFDFWSFG